MKHFIICNSGRSGSNWISCLLSILEIPCTHERVEVHRGINDSINQLRNWEFVGDSSHTSSIIMKQIPRDIVVFYQYKNKKYVTETLSEDGFLPDYDKLLTPLDTSLMRFVNPLFYKAFPELKDMSQQNERIAYLYDTFMEHAQQRADLIYNIEDMNVDLLIKILTAINAPRVYFNRNLLQNALDFIPMSAYPEKYHATVEVALTQ